MISGFLDLLTSLLTSKQVQQQRFTDPLLNKGWPLTRDEAQTIVFRVCTEAGLTPFLAALIYSHGLQESGYEANVFKKNNNAFGMKYSNNPFVAGRGTAAPGSEAKTASDKARNVYARYDSLANSVRDVIRRQNAYGIDWKAIKTPEDYVNFCKVTKYFQGNLATYRSNVKSFMKKLNITADGQAAGV